MTLFHEEPVSKRIGIAKGKLKSPDDPARCIWHGPDLPPVGSRTPHSGRRDKKIIDKELTIQFLCNTIEGRRDGAIPPGPITDERKQGKEHWIIMKSVVINAPRSFADAEKEKPTAGGKWVTIKVKDCAICGSDNMFWNGYGGFDFTPGHEFSGYIEDGGEYGFAKGTKVLAAEFNSCGECEFCRSGREQLCAQMMADNPGVSAPGAFGKYVRVRGDYVIPMPEDMPIRLGAIVEPVSVALHGVKYLNIQPGEDVLISGNGPIGIYAAATAKLLGAGRVVMTGRSQSRVDFCNTFDFVDVCLSVKDPEYGTKIRDLTPAGGFRNIIDCVGVDDYDGLLDLAKSGATIVMLGMHAAKASFTPMSLYMKEASIRTGLYFSWADFRQAFEMVRDNPTVFLPTITSVIPDDAASIQKAFEKLFASGTNDECKILIEHED